MELHAYEKEQCQHEGEPKEDNDAQPTHEESDQIVLVNEAQQGGEIEQEEVEAESTQRPEEEQQTTDADTWG